MCLELKRKRSKKQVTVVSTIRKSTRLAKHPGVDSVENLKNLEAPSESEKENMTGQTLEDEQVTPMDELINIAREVENSSHILDSTVEHFATFFEENRAEVSSVIESIKKFADKVAELEKVLQNIEELVKVFGDFSERISDIADDITVLSINSSVEIHKETIDRNALGKISEMIMILANSVREISKNTKKHLKRVQDIAAELTSNIEGAVGEVTQVHETLKTLESLNKESLKQLEVLVGISKSSRKTVEKLLRTVNILKERVEEIRQSIIQLLD